MKITHHKNGEIKTLVEEAPYHPGYEDVGFEPKVLNNKPVAWMQVHYKDKMCVTKLSPVQTWEDDIPLYTHPVKELTDEEIDEISKEVWERPWLEVHRKFAKAILRKAQEK